MFLTELVEIRSYLLELTPTSPCAAATRHTTGVAIHTTGGLGGVNHCYKGDGLKRICQRQMASVPIPVIVIP